MSTSLTTQSFAFLRSAVLFPAPLAVALTSTVAIAQAPVADSQALEAKAHAWLEKLTLQQKVELVGGVDGIYTHGGLDWRGAEIGIFSGQSSAP